MLTLPEQIEDLEKFSRSLKKLSNAILTVEELTTQQCNEARDSLHADYDKLRFFQVALIKEIVNAEDIGPSQKFEMIREITH